MCGISGILSYSHLSEDDAHRLNKASLKLAHRGPDDDGFYVDDKVALAHRRLSILDLSKAGHQPMTDESGRYVLVYNGECYNYKELKSQILQGDNFHSTGDTEVILKLLIQEGAACLKRINGFFSLAFYDKNTGTVLLARDRFGIKPLYVSTDSNQLVFGSEMRVISEVRDKLTLNRTALSAYLHLNYIPQPHSIFNEVEKIRPGHYQLYTNEGLKEDKAYFQLIKNDDKARSKNIHEELLKLMESSISKRLVSDVPLGSFLSGGLDSSLITGLASKQTNSLNTFTMAFKGNAQYDESKDAALVAAHFKTNHAEITIDENDLLANVPDILNQLDEPFADSSAIAMNHLCKSVSNDIKVALSGDGGDELFAGYYKHKALNYAFQFPALTRLMGLSRPLFNQLPSSRKSGLLNALRKLKRFSHGANSNANDRYWKWAGYGHPLQNELFNNKSFNSREFLHDSTQIDIQKFEDSLESDIKMVLEGDMLVKTDRNSMQYGLEVRVPMLDHELVEFVHNIDVKFKIDMKGGKRILREICKDILPEQILNKKKHGFEVPLKKWLNQDLHSIVDELLDSELIRVQGLFDPGSVEKLKSKLKNTASENSEYAVWNLMAFNQWWLNYRDKLK